MTTRRDVNVGILSAIGAAAHASTSLAQSPHIIDLPPPSTAKPAPKMNAPCSYPVRSASQSPSAVPSVCENVIASQ